MEIPKPKSYDDKDYGDIVTIQRFVLPFPLRGFYSTLAITLIL